MYHFGRICAWLKLSLALVCFLGINGELFECDQYRNCFCTEEVVTCSFSHISAVPIFSPFLIKLNLSQNELNIIKPNVFGHLSLLQSLDLSHNQLANLRSLTFSSLGNLRQLNLAHNRINQIAKNTFKNLHELQELHLEGNPLMNLDGDVFYDLHSLTQLTVARRISISHSELFHWDDRPLLCQCTRLKEMWHVVKNFAFCEKLGHIVPENELKKQCTFLVDSLGNTLNINNNSSKPIMNKTNIALYEEGKQFRMPSTIQDNEQKRPPIWRHVPESLVRAKSGSMLTWKCEASGNPKPSLKWFKRNRLLKEDGTLTLGPINPDDEDTYECMASNEAGIAAKEVKLYVTGGSMHNEKPRYLRLEQMMNKTSLQETTNQVYHSKTIIKALRNVTDFVETVRLLLRQSDDGKMFPGTGWTQPNWLTPVQQMVMFNYTGCVGGSHVQVLDCQQYLRYRAITGVCNNLAHPLKGSQMTPFIRLLPSRYEDGLAKPVGWFSGKQYKNRTIPDAKAVTNKLLSTKKLTPDPRHNHMLMQFGQFLDHDLTFTSPSRSWNILEDNVIDCRKTCHYVEPCFSVRSHPMLISNSSQSRNCIEVVRSAELCGTGFTSIIHGKFIPREQVNQLTAFVDGSNIYGSTDELARYLRDLNPDLGLLKTSQVDDKAYLPLSDEHFPLDCQLQPNASFMECFLAGDHRANEQIGLLTFHNVWLRQHNRLATKLRTLHPNWSGEQIYQEIRKIVGAQLQVITYRDWLPLVIGKNGMHMMGLYRGYNSSVDATISNVFATAAMRFGHTLVNTHLIKQLATNSSRSTSSGQDMKLRKLFFASHMLYQPKRVDSIMRGLLVTPLKKPKPEQAISSELTDHLFELSRHVPLDLASINIQRGRDHALPSYNEWRLYCGLSKAKTFDDLASEIRNKDIRNKLKELYGHPDNIDLWVGAILEEADNDAKVGPTFRCLLVEQFIKLRDGDRYFYKLPSVFTTEQLTEIEKTTLSKVICANGDNLTTIIGDAFKLPKYQTWTKCNGLPDVDLNKW